MLNSLLVLAGAVVGLAGGVFATIYAQYRQSQREIHKELRSNLLTVILEVSKVFAWAEKEGNYYSTCLEDDYITAASRKRTHAEPYPIQKIQAIVSLYFPKILDHARALTRAGLHHQMTARMLLQVRFNVSRGKGSQKDIDAQRDNVYSAFQDLAKEQERFEEAAQELMSELLKEKS